MASSHEFNGTYTGRNLERVAFPIGGIGAGMFCLEGVGGITQMSIRNKMEFQHEPPCTFAALTVKGDENVARVLEGPNPEWKYFGGPGTGNGAAGYDFGLPRFQDATFEARFPFATVALNDPAIPLECRLTGWSPFIPGNADDSSLPAGALEYTFTNPTNAPVAAMFSFNSKNFLAAGNEGHGARATRNGFVFWREGTEEKPFLEGACAVWVDDDDAVVDHCWFKGGWWDAVTLAWRNAAEGIPRANPPQEGPVPGASLFVPFTLRPGEEKTIRLSLAWYVPKTDVRHGPDPEEDESLNPCTGGACCCDDGAAKYAKDTHQPWYVGRFGSVEEVVTYWDTEYARLRGESAAFRDAFYDSILPPVVLEAIAANLTILKSPTVLRQPDGRIWAYEGCSDNIGCCPGSCTHVWNYAQAMPHLFPDLERTLRETEHFENQYANGAQAFRGNLPIRPLPDQGQYGVASDGQLGGVMKTYREWRIAGDTDWLRKMWPRVKASLDFCISYWDPKETGTLVEHHHNTYDIDYWGPDGHCGSFYLGSLKAASEMGKTLGDDVSRYEALLEKGREALETELWNGEYFFQKIQWEENERPYTPLDASSNGEGYRGVVELLNEQGPRYQYGTGCLSDGVLGFWMARACGLEEPIVDEDKVRANLQAIHKYNLRHDLRDHANPQRPSYAMGDDGGLLLCTWPHGGALALPFVYSNEVWTGIEYQVASHLMMEGFVDEGLEIVRILRTRHDGARRNPFNEYECGHWYARAMASYGLIQGLTGLRYDAVGKTLYVDSRIGDFRAFLSTATGFGVVELKDGQVTVDVRMGTVDVAKTVVAGKPA